jgi:putative hydrolases of HD superfamily
MDVTAVFNLLLHGNQLKRTARTGWVQRGVPDAENVAAHSYGVACTTLILGSAIQQPMDLNKALVMAILHDLPEALTTDIPTPAWRFLPSGTKRPMERAALAMILADLPFAGDLTAVWEELHLLESKEAWLVHDADRIDLFLQAWIYEAQTGNRHLAEFWSVPHEFHFPEAQAIYDKLVEQRGEATGESSGN